MVSRNSVGRGTLLGKERLRKLRMSEVNDGTAECTTGGIVKIFQNNDRRFGKSGSVKGARVFTNISSEGEDLSMNRTRRV